MSTARIRELNDAARVNPFAVRHQWTPGVYRLGTDWITGAMAKIIDYDDFNDGDPFDLHDSGAIEFHSQQARWCIAYLDPEIANRSGDPADPATIRILWMWLPEEVSDANLL